MRKIRNNTKVDVEKWKQAIQKSLGIVGIAMMDLNVSKTKFYNTLEKYPQLKEELENIRESVKDKIELTLYRKALDEEDTTCLIFLSKIKCRDRGYAPTLIEMAERLPALKIKIVGADDDTPTK